MNKLRYILIGMLLGITLFIKLIANSQPFLVKHLGVYYFPIFINYTYKDFGFASKRAIDFNDELVVNAISKTGFIMYSFIKYDYKSITSEGYVKSLPPSSKHCMGTTLDGRDVLGYLLYSISILLWSGLLITALSVAKAILLGVLQGYVGGYVDITMQRLYEITTSIPIIYVIFFFNNLIQLNYLALGLLLSLFNWGFLMPYVRAITLQKSSQSSIKNLASLGIPKIKIMFKYLIPSLATEIKSLIPFVYLTYFLILISADFFNINSKDYDSPKLGQMVLLGLNNQENIWVVASSCITILCVSLLCLSFTFKRNN
jgi:ABC-type microcin C transport system permease subunit YejE